MVEARVVPGLVPLAVAMGPAVPVVAVVDHGAVAVGAVLVTQTAVAMVVAG